MTEQQFQTKVLKHRRSIDYYDNLIGNEKDHDTRIELYDKFVSSLLALSRLEKRFKKQLTNKKMKNKFKPTFPVAPQRPWDDESASGYLGLDKREHFALHLMTALISNADRHSQEGDCQTWNYEHLSEIAIQAADALLSKLDQVQVSQ